MGRRSKINGLPKDILEELDARLIDSGFANYRELAAWLKGRGHDICKSAVHCYGRKLEAQFNEAIAESRRTRALARAARQEGGEQDTSLLEAASSIMQDNLLRVSMEVKHADDDPATKAKTLSQIARAFSDVGRLDIARQKWQSEINAKLTEAANNAAKLATKGGLSAESVAEIRSSILGIKTYVVGDPDTAPP